MSHLKTSEALQHYREILLINRLIFFILVIMTFYIPIEIVMNGPALVPEILVEVGFLTLTLYFNHKQWFNFSKLYFFFACIISILPMMYIVPAGAGNEFLLLPIALIPAILFQNRWLGSFMFLVVLIIFFVVINTREWIHPIIEVTPEQIAFFRNIYLAMTFALTFIIVFYFRTIVNDFEVINQQKNKLLELSNEEITAKKIEIETQHNEIKSSINYAKRIQTAILPSDVLIQKNLPQSFVLYKPKDIVAGDFYWLEPKDGKILFAAADCTGHGVPGAMVSVVCNNALNQSVKEFGITQPSLILDKTRDLVIAAFAESSVNVQDGMDIALCSLNIKTNELQFSGANNPLWIIRKDSTEIEEIKGDKQPIGNFENATNFTNHSIQLMEGDCIYIFSDGYVDQFGGPKEKKLNAKSFKELLLLIYTNPLPQQKILINNHFEAWKSNLEQIDDVCVIGVRIN